VAWRKIIEERLAIVAMIFMREDRQMAGSEEKRGFWGGLREGLRKTREGPGEEARQDPIGQGQAGFPDHRGAGRAPDHS
jgi:hypothetical protein